MRPETPWESGSWFGSSACQWNRAIENRESRIENPLDKPVQARDRHCGPVVVLEVLRPGDAAGADLRVDGVVHVVDPRLAPHAHGLGAVAAEPVAQVGVLLAEAV